ncbi:hypothetical protein L6R50_26710 [Myxococcota bacterium]|nr:hypothetical protein [Myxococcota bacterium]
METWAEALREWGGHWRDWLDEQVRRLGAAVQRDPEAHRPAATRSLEDLAVARGQLDAIKHGLRHLEGTADHVPAVANFNRLNARWWDLATAVYGHSDQAGRPAFGALPVVVLVIGTLGLTVAGVVAAVAAREYTTNLREQTALQLEELRARVEASKEGRALQDTTLPQPPAADGDRVGWWVLGGLTVLAGAFTLPVLLKKGT